MMANLKHLKPNDKLQGS